jgi:hypothetical protein
MKHVFTTKKGDQNLFLKYYDRLEELSDENLIEVYFRESRIGMTGVHAQAVYILALRKVMKHRFGKSFISLNGRVIDLG